MTIMQILRHQALQSCEFRGHIMKRFKYNKAHTTGTSTCKICGKEVQIKTWPKSNEIDIGGDAFVLSCED